MGYDYHISQNELKQVYVPYLDRSPETGHFIKGLSPWNKGLKGVCIGGVETQFKTGHEPHNTKHDGCISLRFHKRMGVSYYFIRVAKGKWQHLNRYNWEKANGPIPKGYCIAFIDGNILNCDISNLKLISRQENLRRNYNKPKAAETMKKLWRSESLRVKYDLPRKTKLRIK